MKTITLGKTGLKVQRNAFGALLSSVMLNAPMLPERERTAAHWMLYNLGKWVYLIDAWDDREKDEKNGSYNPFLLTQMQQEQVKFVLNITLNEAKKAYDLLTQQAPSGLLENIMTLGLEHAQERVLMGERGCTASVQAQNEEGDKE